jgi:hypothetical protein
VGPEGAELGISTAVTTEMKLQFFSWYLEHSSATGTPVACETVYKLSV